MFSCVCHWGYFSSLPVLETQQEMWANILKLREMATLHSCHHNNCPNWRTDPHLLLWWQISHSWISPYFIFLKPWRAGQCVNYNILDQCFGLSRLCKLSKESEHFRKQMSQLHISSTQLSLFYNNYISMYSICFNHEQPLNHWIFIIICQAFSVCFFIRNNHFSVSRTVWWLLTQQ